MRSALFFGIILAVVGLVGCGSGYEIVEVSGRITLDNQPLADAHVSFNPVEGSEPGPGASGKTDKDGRYTLTTYTQKTEEQGALVGKHRVMISTLGETPGDADVNDPRRRDKVPPEYNVNSKLTFDVPEGGTDKANFDLVSR